MTSTFSMSLVWWMYWKGCRLAYILLIDMVSRRWDWLSHYLLQLTSSPIRTAWESKDLDCSQIHTIRSRRNAPSGVHDKWEHLSQVQGNASSTYCPSSSGTVGPCQPGMSCANNNCNPLKWAYLRSRVATMIGIGGYLNQRHWRIRRLGGRYYGPAVRTNARTLVQPMRLKPDPYREGL